MNWRYGVFAIFALMLGTRDAIGALDVDKLIDLVAVCEKAERAMQTGISGQQILEAGGCYGFINGFLQTKLSYDQFNKGPNRFCAPAPFKRNDIILIFNAFLRQQPKWRVIAREKPAVALVAALQDSWPCPRQ
jgi:hypothetical protein